MNKMKKLSVITLMGLLGLIIYMTGCVKQDFDTPPIGQLPEGKVYTIADLRQMFSDSGAFMINYDASCYSVVTMDESSGNIYKSAYIQDNTGAVNLHLDNSGGLRIGDSIRLYLKGVILNEYNGLFQLDQVNNDSNIVILANKQYIQPKPVTIQDLNSGDYQSQLIRLEDVQFIEQDLGFNWADEGAPGNRTLEDCNGNTVLVRTSDYSSFADLPLPQGNGSFTAIASEYSATVQLIVRTLSEIDLDGDRCGGGGGEPIPPVDEVREEFNDVTDYENIDLDGWTNVVVAGTRYWQGKSFDANKYAQATGYNSGLDDMETWLITPPVINTSGDKILSFKSAIAYWTHQGDNVPLKVMASTDYDGTNFETATWTELTPNLPDANSGNYDWIESGDVSLADFVGNVAIAFKYKGSGTETTSSQIDDVMITDEGGGGGEPIPPVSSIAEHFDNVEDYTNVAIEGWTNLVVQGTRYWQGKTFDANKYAQATGYNSGLDAIETWLITPPVINTSGDKVLTFNNAMAYWQHTSGQPLTILASTDYDGTNFETATWTELSANLAGSGDDNYQWVESGEISLAAFTGNVAIAFKYVGSDTESTSIQIDDVIVNGGGGNDGVTEINEDFQSQTNYEDINIPGWLNVATEGSRVWQGKEYSGNLYAQATSYNSGETNVTWMITPKMDLNAMNNPVFEFKSAQAYWVHDGLTVLISTDFDGTNVESATWTPLDCTLAGSGTPDHEWVSSGKIYLSSFTGPAYIAFKYEGSDPDQTTSYRIDDVLLYDE